MVCKEILRASIPTQCIEECSAPGPADEVVKRWLPLVKEHIPFTKEEMIEGLIRYGAWERVELVVLSPDHLMEKVLWLACGDFSDDETLDAWYLPC